MRFAVALSISNVNVSGPASGCDSRKQTLFDSSSSEGQYKTKLELSSVVTCELWFLPRSLSSFLDLDSLYDLCLSFS